MTGKNRTILLCLLAGSLLASGCASTMAVRKDQAEAHYRLANSHLQQGRGFLDETNRRKAYPELQQAIQLDPENAQYRLLLGTLFLYNKELIPAEREIKKAVELDPELGDARNNLGLVYIEQGRLMEAIMEFKKAVSNLSYQTAEIAYFNLGRASYLIGDFTQAAESFERSLSMLPGNEEAQFLLGRSYAKLGRLESASQAFEAALKLKEDSVRSHYENGMVLFKLQRREEAVRHFNRVVELDPESEMATQSKTFIKLLR